MFLPKLTKSKVLFGVFWGGVRGEQNQTKTKINLAVQYFYDFENIRLYVLQFKLQNHKHLLL